MVIKTYHIIIAAMLIIMLQTLALSWLGHSFICPCGYIKIWEGAVRSLENSQHLFDWYSLSHIVYGFILYCLLWPIRKKFGWPAYAIFLLVLLISAGWEIFENTRFVIDHYRTNTMSFDYYGDSVVNSLMDTLNIVLGWWMAYVLPVGAVLLIAIAFEFILTFSIHDNIILHAIMFIHPFEEILQWQKG